ncbi:ABC transporter ATP-binding protein [Noviherbaspirillum galbum]|uniref:ATP-binding cassette domain-containing protein n=1 Tax=Noviherbaspirillum galbum TaxID=2709383 RepID=A0A6B3SUK8_9BURK|nr:ATP-binding cassette domain-containing protein [Noviherbaspirillum galbum]NEX64364.1 ATP-binding cassette domain-containing protein [Noviherbaspirillum galbum]
MIEFSLRKSLTGASGILQLDAAARLEDRGMAALFGPSGAGKTTLLRMLAGLTLPDDGRIVVDGETWYDAKANVVLPPQRRSVGFVFQDHALFPNMNVRENIAYGAPRGEDRWIAELLEMTALDRLAGQLPRTLSGGQQQRVALARAIARKPRLLLLDEALSALDPALRARLQDDLKALHARLGLTTLLVSHDVGEVFKLAGRVLVLDGGKIGRTGTPQQVFLQERLSGKLNVHARVLAVRREDVVQIVSLLIGQDIVEVIASDDEVAGMAAGDEVTVSMKAFSPFLFAKARS